MAGATEDRGGSMMYVCLLATVAALGGLLFGYDTAVISGAIGFLQLHFELDPQLWKGWAAACALIGCAVGAASAGLLSDHFGRKKVLIAAAVLFFVSALGTAFPPNFHWFVVYRIIGGLGVGAASMTSPMYIAEISPARVRGRMVSVNQFAIVFGMLVVYFVNYFIAGYGVEVDRLSAGPIAERIAAELAQHNGKMNRQTIAQLRDQIAAEVSHRGIEKDERFAAGLADLVVVVAERHDLPMDERAAADVSARAVAEMNEKDIDKEVRITNDMAEVIAAAMAKRPAAAIRNELIGQDVQIEVKAPPEVARKVAAKMAQAAAESAAKRDVPLAAPTVATMAELIFSEMAEAPRAWNERFGWRWMFGSEALPAAMLLLLMSLVPESPRWLTKRQRRPEALDILTRVGGTGHAATELAEIEEAIAQESESLTQLFQPGMRIVLIVGVILAVLQQITGINVFLYYAPEIFKKMGTGANVALLQTVLVGAVNLGFTVIAIWTVDRLGRKPLMLTGFTGMGISLAAMGLAAYCGRAEVWVLAFILGYIACFAISVGPVTWVILSEIFPTRIRGRAMAVATVCLWVANFVVTQTFTLMDEDRWLTATFRHAFPFWVYGVFSVVSVLFVWQFVPETKARTLEEIERSWTKTPLAAPQSPGEKR